MYPKITFLACLLVFVLACRQAPSEADVPLYSGQDLDTTALLETIAFGSCNDEDDAQGIWSAIGAFQPDLWIWLGDNIYGDTEDMEVMRGKYLQQKNHPEYQAFRQDVPVVGVWDDHDYGVNDGGKEYPKKEESSQLMFDFLDVSPGDDVRKRPGAYQSYTFGPMGKQVKVILLDTRWFRDPLERDRDGYVPTSGDMLGAAQWAWLERELTGSEAEVHLIGSSIQLIPEAHPYEKWANLPQSRERFLQLLEKTRPRRPLLISGDRHIAELSRLELDPLPEPLYELTASGMTHTWRNAGEEPNPHRVGELIISKNFGLIRIDWSGTRPQISLEVRSDQGKRLLQHPL